MSASEVSARVEKSGVVPVVRARSAELAERAMLALREGGIEVFEVTLTVPGAIELIRSTVRSFGAKAVVGAGSVITGDDARRCIEAGAEFIVSPGFDPEVVEVAARSDVAVMPGALTPTEVIRAWRAGAAMVKIFPCSALGGPSYLKALRAPLPNVKLLPTGGVSIETAADYIRAGASALGVGGNLVDEAALDAGEDELLTERARELLAIVAAARKRT